MPSTGFLHNEVKVSSLWRGFPNVVTSAIALPNLRKPDGYDYYAFSKGKFSKIVTASQNVTKSLKYKYNQNKNTKCPMTTEGEKLNSNTYSNAFKEGEV